MPSSPSRSNSSSVQLSRGTPSAAWVVGRIFGVSATSFMAVVLSAIGMGGNASPLLQSRHPLLLPDQIDEAGKEVVAVLRARRGLGMVLHREHRPVLEPQPAIGAVEQRHVRLLRLR